MRSTTLALLAFGLTSTLPTGAAAADLVTIRTTGFVHGTDGLGLFGQGSAISSQAFEIAYFFTVDAGTRQNTTYYNLSDFVGPRPPAEALFEVETRDKFLTGPLAPLLPKVELTIGGQTFSFEANGGFSAEVIDYFRRAASSDRVFNLAAFANVGPSPYFSFELSQFLIQLDRFPSFGDDIAGPLPPTSILASYSTPGSSSLGGDYGHFRARRCISIGVGCEETLLDFSFTSTIDIDGVPEAPTWGMLLMGFGVTGYALRRRSKGTKRGAQV